MYTWHARIPPNECNSLTQNSSSLTKWLIPATLLILFAARSSVVSPVTASSPSMTSIPLWLMYSSSRLTRPDNPSNLTILLLWMLSTLSRFKASRFYHNHNTQVGQCQLTARGVMQHLQSSDFVLAQEQTFQIGQMVKVSNGLTIQQELVLDCMFQLSVAFPKNWDIDTNILLLFCWHPIQAL